MRVVGIAKRVDYWDRAGYEPQVSILCITYNHEDYIEDAICGFLMQETTFCFEILIHDDASSDATVSIIEKYAEKFPKTIRLVAQTENQFSKGIPVIATYLFPRARGRYIAICEGDDYWIDPNKLQKQYEALESDSLIGFCGHASVNVAEDGRRIVGRSCMYPRSRVVAYEDVLSRLQSFATASFFVRRDLCEKYFASTISRLSAHGDHKMTLYFGMQSKIYYISDYMSVYRTQSKSSINRSIQQMTDSRPYHRLLLENRLQLLDAIDAETCFAYKAAIQIGRDEMRYRYLMATDQGRLLLRDYRDRVETESLKRQAKVAMSALFPRLFPALNRCRLQKKARAR